MANKFNVSPRQDQKKKINDTYEYIVVTITRKSLLQNIKTRLAKPNAKDPITFCKHLIVSAPLSSAADAGPGEEASRLGPGAPTGGAGGPSNAGEGAGALCFLPFFVFFFDLLGAAAGTSALGVTAGVEAVGGELTGTGVGGELTGTGAGGELTGAGFGGVLTGATTGGDAAGDLATGTGAAGETAGVTVAAVGDEAGGDDFGEATGAGDFGLVGAATGAAEGVVTVGGDVVGADDGD